MLNIFLNLTFSNLKPELSVNFRKEIFYENGRGRESRAKLNREKERRGKQNIFSFYNFIFTFL